MDGAPTTESEKHAAINELPNKLVGRPKGTVSIGHADMARKTALRISTCLGMIMGTIGGLGLWPRLPKNDAMDFTVRLGLPGSNQSSMRSDHPQRLISRSQRRLWMLIGKPKHERQRIDFFAGHD